MFQPHKKGCFSIHPYMKMKLRVMAKYFVQSIIKLRAKEVIVSPRFLFCCLVYLEVQPEGMRFGYDCMNRFFSPVLQLLNTLPTPHLQKGHFLLVWPYKGLPNGCKFQFPLFNFLWCKNALKACFYYKMKKIESDFVFLFSIESCCCRNVKWNLGRAWKIEGKTDQFLL